MIAMVLVLALVVLSWLAVRFGSDSREVGRSGWIIERPRPLKDQAVEDRGAARPNAPAVPRSGRTVALSTRA